MNFGDAGKLSVEAAKLRDEIRGETDPNSLQILYDQLFSTDKKLVFIRRAQKRKKDLKAIEIKKRIEEAKKRKRDSTYVFECLRKKEI